MARLRAEYIEIDKVLCHFDDKLEGSAAGKRAIALARTNLEISLQYAIKSLCILGEE